MKPSKNSAKPKAPAAGKKKVLARKTGGKKTPTISNEVISESDGTQTSPLEDAIHRLLEIFKSASVDLPTTSPLPSEVEKFREKVYQTWNYVPSVCLIGQTGSGKSTLCNTLFGSRHFDVSAVEACTKDKQELVVEFGGKSKLMLVDMPGVGESDEADEKHVRLYEEIAPKADVVLWVLKADSRSYAADLRFWSKIRGTTEANNTPVFFVLSQADKIDPSRNGMLEKACLAPSHWATY